eukprot:TRINITY_DN32401_c0_g1_i6.p1 TRINITY_DN32401_c0_g1~~TRINITY_DN32401_c0_g1_i6.p1  ORF type:complete len:186 (-),score=-9.89 TRINITY_DN32401_c0_g1_i6:141-698(-)
MQDGSSIVKTTIQSTKLLPYSFPFKKDNMKGNNNTTLQIITQKILSHQRYSLKVKSQSNIKIKINQQWLLMFTFSLSCRGNVKRIYLSHAPKNFKKFHISEIFLKSHEPRDILPLLERINVQDNIYSRYETLLNQPKTFHSSKTNLKYSKSPSIDLETNTQGFSDEIFTGMIFRLQISLSENIEV